jgi:hypothetical protein
VGSRSQILTDSRRDLFLLVRCDAEMSDLKSQFHRCNAVGLSLTRFKELYGFPCYSGSV